MVKEKDYRKGDRTYRTSGDRHCSQRKGMKFSTQVITERIIVGKPGREGDLKRVG